jgi:hypothetical protein
MFFCLGEYLLGFICGINGLAQGFFFLTTGPGLFFFVYFGLLFGLGRICFYPGGGAFG